jgi:large subunit ribosomal protein L35
MTSFTVSIGNNIITDCSVSTPEGNKKSEIRQDIELTFKESQQKPKIKYDRSSNEYFTILMVDPDAPRREAPEYKYFLHMLVVNNDSKILSYEPPNPPIGSGKHRYIFYLLKQKHIITKDNLIIPNKDQLGREYDRKKFNLMDFIMNNKLEFNGSVCFETERKK